MVYTSIRIYFLTISSLCMSRPYRINHSLTLFMFSYFPIINDFQNYTASSNFHHSHTHIMGDRRTVKLSLDLQSPRSYDVLGHFHIIFQEHHYTTQYNSKSALAGPEKRCIHEGDSKKNFARQCTLDGISKAHLPLRKVTHYGWPV